MRAVRDPHDDEARERMMYAATLAGIGFGNAGVPRAARDVLRGLPGCVRDFRPPGYPRRRGDGAARHVGHRQRALGLPFQRGANPARHLEAARLLGADVRDAADADAGEALARRSSS